MKIQITKKQNIILTELFNRYDGVDNGRAYIEEDFINDGVFDLVFETDSKMLYIDECGNVIHSGGKPYGNFEELSVKAAAAAMGSIKSGKKAKSSAQNGKKGGRPVNPDSARQKKMSEIIAPKGE